MTADVQRELAEALRRAPGIDVLWPGSDTIAAALLPTVQRLIADAEKRAAAAALRDAADLGTYMFGMPEVIQGWELRVRADDLDPT